MEGEEAPPIYLPRTYQKVVELQWERYLVHDK